MYKEDRNVSNVTQIKDHFVKTSQSSSVNYFDNVVRGMATQRSQKIDTTYTDAVSNLVALLNHANLILDLLVIYFTLQLTHYWYTRSDEFGTDLLSLDIQRGRDHGIPAYVHFRKFCNLSEIQSFKDLGNVIVQPVRVIF